MSDEFLRVLNAPVDDDESALAQLWEEYTLSHVDESSDSDSESTEEDDASGPGAGAGADTEGADTEVDDDEFDMLRSDLDVAIERAVALPEYVLQEQDDILKAAAFRYVSSLMILCACGRGSIRIWQS